MTISDLSESSPVDMFIWTQRTLAASTLFPTFFKSFAQAQALHASPKLPVISTQAADVALAFFDTIKAFCDLARTLGLAYFGLRIVKAIGCIGDVWLFNPASATLRSLRYSTQAANRGQSSKIDKESGMPGRSRRKRRSASISSWASSLSSMTSLSSLSTSTSWLTCDSSASGYSKGSDQGHCSCAGVETSEGSCYE